ncbi:MAG: GFA family protein [Chloroflexota bacterium]
MLELPATGRCQCGTCCYAVEAPPYVAYTCHCTECQKLSSSAFVSCMHVPVESVRITKGSPISCKRIADSGHLLETWFCPACGSTLFAENSSRPRVRTVHIGTLEHPECVDVSAHIWVKRKVPWICLPENHRVFQEAGDWTEEYADDLPRYKPQE